MSTIKSSAENLTLNADGANNDIKFQSNGVEKASIDQDGNLVLSGTLTSLGIDDNADATAITIDSNEQVTMGGTTLYPGQGNTATGQHFENSGTGYLSRTGGYALGVNRNTSDGTVINFARQGTSVGSIDASTSGISIKLGGTGAANTLDDYEVGTWTPTITCSSSGSYTLDTGANAAAYTKVGRVVHIQGGISVASANSPSGTIRMSLPFTSFTGSKDTDYALGTCALSGAGGTIDNGIYIFAFGTAYVQFPMISDSGSFSYLANGNVDSAWVLKFTLSYIAV